MQAIVQKVIEKMGHLSKPQIEGDEPTGHDNPGPLRQSQLHKSQPLQLAQ